MADYSISDYDPEDPDVIALSDHVCRKPEGQALHIISGKVVNDELPEVGLREEPPSEQKS